MTTTTMVGSAYSEKLKNRTNRLKLPIKKKAYKVLIAPMVALGGDRRGMTAPRVGYYQIVREKRM